MAQSLAFNIGGANPTSSVQTNDTSSPAFAYKGSPVTFNPSTVSNTPAKPTTYGNQVPGPISLGTNPGLISPSTPVKSHTVTNTDGSTVTQTYHAPATASESSTSSATPSPAPQANSVAGANQSIAQNGGVAPSAQGMTDTQAGINQNTGNFGSSASQNASGQVQPQPATTGFIPNSNTNATPPTNASDPNAYAGYLSSLGNSQNSPYNQTVGNQVGLLNQTGQGSVSAGNQGSAIGNYYGNLEQQIATPFNNQAIGALTSGGSAPVSQGRAGLAYQNLAAEQSNLSAAEQAALAGNAQSLQGQSQAASAYGTGAGAANTAQGNVQSATGAAASGSAPVAGATFFGNQITGGLYGQGNNLISSNIALAQKLIANGANVNDPQVQSLLAGTGIVGANALTSGELGASGGSYNPTAQSQTSSTIANTNASLGSQYQTQASNLSTSLSQLTNTANQAQSLLQGHPELNSSNTPVGNAQIDTYLQNIGDPAAVTNYNAVLADVQKFQSAITSTGSGLTPTQTTQNIIGQDPSKMSAPQLASYIQTLQQLGQSQHNVLSGAASNAYYSQGPASGIPTNVNTSNVQTPGGGNSNLAVTPTQAGQIGEGVAVNSFSSILSGISNLLPEISSFIAGKSL